jgi:catechol 2,3-dioxygenase-like lactoylglutathione lyase family enzyme
MTDDDVVPDRGGPRLEVTSVTISCPDPRALADFYARLLGVEVGTVEGPGPGEPEGAGWAQLRTGRVTLNFEHERHWRAPVWPAQEGGQSATQHLDVHVDDLEAAQEWAVTCGARLARYQPQPGVRVLLDPAGHPFCLFSG